MFTCSACLRQSLKNLDTDLAPNTSSVLFRSKANIALRSSSVFRRNSFSHHHSIRRTNFITHRRSHATLASLRKGHHRQQLQYLLKASKAKNSPVGRDRRKAPWALTKVEIRDAVARDKNRARLREESGEIEDVDADEDEDVLKPSELPEPSKQDEARELKNRRARRDEDTQERRLMRRDKKEVEVYYKDPLQLADGVLNRLRIPDIEGALRLVRASQAYEINNIVSWNHCCDWLMAHGQMKQALSIYNEMKKRGQKPDAHTYTIMLRGFSQHVDKPNAVSEAVKIYNSIFAPNSAVKPNIIHTNAIINVCARGGDMDSLWAVAGRLPERGAGSPDRYTFATILNAIRENTMKEVASSIDTLKPGNNAKKLSEEEAAEERGRLYGKAVEDGRKLWEDISHRWRRADLVIDEQLVCAMGRLLLACGVGKDVEQVLDLVEVTMNLRIKERVKTGKQQTSWIEGPAQTISDEVSTLGKTESVSKGLTEPSKLPLKDSNVYATPGRNTLSMLLQACSQLRSIQHFSTIYWQRLTSPQGQYRIEPDAANIMVYLRLLRMQRASADAYKLLAHDWPKDVAKVLFRRASFVIAFSTCLRDKRNPNVFKTAQKMLQLAEERSDERAVGMYDENMALGDMSYHKRKQALQNAKKELALMTEEEREEATRNQEGVQSLTVDPKLLNYFVELAVATTQGWNEGLRGKDDGTVFERHPTKNHTMVALMTVASRTKDLKRLVKAKMEELQNSDMPRRRKERALDPRAGSRVGEDLDDLLQLMKTMISAWDKCLEVHERFKKAGKGALDANLMSGFHDRKREMTAYMARVEKTVGVSLRQRGIGGRVRQADADEDPDDEDESKPDIERRIKAVLDGVDSNLVETRMKAKNRTSPSTRRYGDSKNSDLKLSSRRQKRERDNLIEDRMGKAFPKEDYGTLNSDLEVVSGSNAKQSQRDEQKRLADQGFAKGLSFGESLGNRRTRSAHVSGIRRLKDRVPREASPRFGLPNLKVEDVPVQTTSIRKTAGMSEWQDTDPSLRTRSSILDRSDVKSAWSRPASAGVSG